jgi:hypothetical protein
VNSQFVSPSDEALTVQRWIVRKGVTFGPPLTCIWTQLSALWRVEQMAGTIGLAPTRLFRRPSITT